MYKKIGPLAVLLLLSSQFAVADMAPPEGYVKVSCAIVLQADDDLTDYRFFIVSGNLAREVTPVKGQTISVSGLGGGALYSAGILYAVPSKNVIELPAQLSRDQSEELSTALTQDQLTGAVELLRHGFSAEVRKEDAATITNAEYRISKTPDGLKAEQVPSLTSSPAPPMNSSGSVSRETQFFPIAGGLFVAAVAIVGGQRQRRTS